MMTDATPDIRNQPPVIPQYRVWYCLYKCKQYGPYLGCMDDVVKQLYKSLYPGFTHPSIRCVLDAIKNEEVLFWTYGAKDWQPDYTFIEVSVEDYVVLCRPPTANKEPAPAMMGQDILCALAELVRLRVSVNELKDNQKTSSSDGK